MNKFKIIKPVQMIALHWCDKQPNIPYMGSVLYVFHGKVKDKMLHIKRLVSEGINASRHALDTKYQEIHSISI
jgi:hypothetical protein